MIFTLPDGDTRHVPLGASLEVLLRFMQKFGSSVELNYGEDTDRWECSWITGGKRTTTVDRDSLLAARACVRKVAEAAATRPLNRGGESQS